MSLVDAFSDDGDTTTRVLAAVLGLLGIIAGLVVMRRPGETLLAVLIVVGIWLVVTGIVDFVRAFANAENRGLRLLGALVDIVLGGLILALPDVSLGTLAVLIGIAFVVRGVLIVVARLPPCGAQYPHDREPPRGVPRAAARASRSASSRSPRSVDGRRFELQAPLQGLDLPPGGYVMLESDGASRLGQVLSLRLEQVRRGRGGVGGRRTARRRCAAGSRSARRAARA